MRKAMVDDEHPFPSPVSSNKCCTYPWSFPRMIKSHSHCKIKNTATYIKGAFTAFAKKYTFRMWHSTTWMRPNHVVTWWGLRENWWLPISVRLSIAFRWDLESLPLLKFLKISCAKHRCSVLVSLDSDIGKSFKKWHSYGSRNLLV